MMKEIKPIVTKTAKIAGATCVAAGAIALLTSAAAIKAMVEGGKYLKDTIENILAEKPEEEAAAQEAVVEAVEEAPAEAVEEAAAEVTAEVVAEEETVAAEEAAL